MKLVSLALFLFCLMGNKGCEKSIPIWKGKIYKANHVESRLERTQSGDFIPTTDPKFSDFICIRQESFDCFAETFVLACDNWRVQSACGLKEEKP